MAHHEKEGHHVQIVRLERGSPCNLDIAALRKVLLADNVKNLPVMVVSVAGTFRKGKSFLMNFFLRYMRNRTQENWMADTNAPLQGFPWRGGSQPETSGILIWSEVFVVTTTERRKVAVVFMDTQGMFDCTSTIKEGATLFAFSMMASSVQIYNLSQNIGEDHLQHLQLFTQYGKLALEETGEKPFQKLIFLVRDWQYPYEWAYGFTGGKGLAEKRLSADEAQEPELKGVRKDIFSSFEEIWCFLMPEPGTKVTSEKTFDGRLSDMDKDFQEYLGVLVSSVLQPNELVVKKINGCDITCQELFYHLEVYAKLFNNGYLPDPKSMFEAAVEANNSTAVDRAMVHYRDTMNEVLHRGKPYLLSSCLELEHFRVKGSALNLFDRVSKFGGVARSQQYKNRLEHMIAQVYTSFAKHNEGQRIKAEEEKIMAKARRKAKKIADRAAARAQRMQIGGAASGIAMTAAFFTPLGPLLAGTLAVACGSSLYVAGEAISGAVNRDVSSDEDSDED